MVSTESGAVSSIVVTGANKGIGYEAVKYLAQKLPASSKIFLTARSQANGDAAIAKMKESVPNCDFKNVHVLLLEVLDQKSIDAAVATVKAECGTLDVLLHNSGILQVNGDLGHRQIFDVNVKAVKATIDAFVPILTKEKGKIIVVSSEVGTWSTHAMVPALQKKMALGKDLSWSDVEEWIDDWQRFKNGEAGVKEPWTAIDTLTSGAYSVSKAFLNAYLRHYCATHPDIKLAIVCPGYCATDLNDNQGFRPASMGGESVVWPVFHDFESGHMYQDGKDMPFIAPCSMPVPPVGYEK